MSSSPHISTGKPPPGNDRVQALLRIQAIVAVLVGCAVALLDAFGGRFDRTLLSALMVAYGLAGIKLAASRSRPAPVLRERPSPRPRAEAITTGGWRAEALSERSVAPASTSSRPSCSLHGNSAR